MSEKELMYIEDALSHLEQIHTFCDDNIIDVENDDISKEIESVIKQNRELFNKFFKLLGN